MAYEQHYNRSTSQNSVLGLASCHSYLDGVPFKISPTFRPPPQPELPAELLNSTVRCEALHEEYEYDTEEAVLAWARAREEAKAKAIAEREAAERARAALAAAESNSSSDSEDDDVPDVSQSSAATQPGQPQSQPPPQPQVMKPPWQLPVAASVSNTILTPMPIQAAKAKVQSPMTPKAQVDLALFEQEGDPFDNLELQTINDMEELRTLLGGANMGGASQEPSPNPDVQAKNESSEIDNIQSNVNNNEGQDSVPQNFVVSSTNDLYVNVMPAPSGVKTVSDSEQPSNMGDAGLGIANTLSSADISNNTRHSGFVIESTGDGDYVQIRPDYSQQSVSFQQDSAPIYGNIGLGAESGLGCELPEQYSNSKVFKQVLPPIRPRGQSLGSELALDGAAGNTTGPAFNLGGQSSVSQSQTNSNLGFAAGGMSQSAYVMSASASGVLDVPGSDFSMMNQNHTYSNLPSSNPRSTSMVSSPAFTNNLYSRYGNCASGSPTPPTSASSERRALRSAKSNPDLSQIGHTVNPARSSPQPWNPYKPLPPTPVSELRSSSSSTESLPTDHRHSPPSNNPTSTSTSASAAASTAVPDVDPYHQLSSEAKTFVNNLTAMGFSRSRASRAVEKFGADEREVLDHLLNVDKLVEKKFTPALAETGLQLFRNDLRKAEQFLDLYQQFTELGFTGDRIQTALVQHQLDRDKALDYLTA